MARDQKGGDWEREREKGEREREREKKEGRRMWVDEGGLAGAGVQGKSFLPENNLIPQLG